MNKTQTDQSLEYIGGSQEHIALTLHNDAVARTTDQFTLNREAIRNHDGRFYHVPSGEYISRRDALWCDQLNIELH